MRDHSHVAEKNMNIDDLKKDDVPGNDPKNPELFCQFCGQPRANVSRLFVSGDTSICTSCVWICAELLDEDLPGWADGKTYGLGIDFKKQDIEDLISEWQKAAPEDEAVLLAKWTYFFWHQRIKGFFKDKHGALETMRDLIKIAELSEFDSHKLSREITRKRFEIEDAKNQPPDITA